MVISASSLLALLLGSGCGTIDPGDNFVPPDVSLDEDFFYCRIQPEVISASTCASGGPGEGGECHADQSSLRLSAMAEADAPPACDGDAVVGPVPDSYMANYQAVQFTVQSDPLSSPFLLRPTGRQSHPREIFPEMSPQADLIIQWISAGGS
jgi:hypothetical protein